jgi:hypothetical protein
VRAGKGKTPQIGQRAPAPIFWRARKRFGEFQPENLERNPEARDRVPHLKKARNAEWTRVEKIFRELTVRCPSGVQFDVWEFPQMRVHHAGRTAAHEEAAVALEDKRREPESC